MRKLIGLISISGPAGKNGLGVPTGGTTGQVLAKKSNTDYDTEWITKESTVDFEDLTNRPKYNDSTMNKDTNIPEVKTTAWDAKLDDAPSDNKKYVRKDGTWVEFVDEDTKDFDLLTNRPKYNGTTMDHDTNIPEVKTTSWDAKSTVSVSSTGTATDEVKYITIDGTEKHIDRGDRLSGLTISVMGDSISTYTNWIPNSARGNHNVWKYLPDGTVEDTGIADPNTLQHNVYYPMGYVTNVNQTWWHQLIYKELKAKIGVIESWSGSFIGNNHDSDSATPTSSTGNDVGPNSCMASVTRIKRLGANGNPDIILYYGGTNDFGVPGRAGENLPTASEYRFDSSLDYSTVDTISTKWANFIDAYRVSLQRMQYYYPKAKIVVLLPTFTNQYYNRAKLDLCVDLMKEVCDYFGVNYIDLRACGITWANSASNRNSAGVQTLGDSNIHPNLLGMKMIAEYVRRKLLTILDDEFEHTPVYTVTNNSDLDLQEPYILAVSEGSPFVNRLINGYANTGRVFMNDVDITSQVYNVATGLINIPSVTGNIRLDKVPHVPVPVLSVTLDKYSETLTVGDTFDLTATVYPVNADNQNVSWSINGQQSIVWHTTHYAEATKNLIASHPYAGFCYTNTYKGTEGDGAMMNAVRFFLNSQGTCTVGKVSADMKTVIDSETFQVTGSEGQLKVINLSKTYTLENGEHFFIGRQTDTATFKYAKPANPVGEFYCYAGYPNAGSTLAAGENLSVDFGYTASPIVIVPVDNICTVVARADGEATVTVTTEDGNKTASCVVRVRNNISLSSIAVTTPPTNTVYAVGENFNTAGMVVTATYSDTTSDIITDDEYTYSPSTLSTPGGIDITISWTYQGVTKTCTQTVTVFDCEGISVTTQPTKTTYGVGELFDPTGMVITGDFSLAGSRTIEDYSYSPITPLTAESTEIVISYRGQTCTQEITMQLLVTDWHTAHYSQGLRGSSANATGYGGFCYMDAYKGTEQDGASMNCIRFYLDTPGTLTIGKANANMTTVVDSEVLNVTGSKGDLIVLDLSKTYTLTNGEHFFCLTKTDTMKFEYCWNNPYPQASDYAEFWCHVGYSNAGAARGGSQNLNFDFGYKHYE